MLRLLKKLFLTASFLSTLFLFSFSTSFAQTPPKFEASISDTNIIITLSGVPAADREEIKVAVSPTTPPSIPVCFWPSEEALCPSNTPKEILTNGTIKWTRPLKSVHGKTTYYVRAEGKISGVSYLSSTVTINTPNEVVDAVWPLTYSVGDTNANISGKLNNVDPEDFTATLQYSTKRFDSDKDESLPVGAKEKVSQKGPQDTTPGINPDHSYIFQLTDLSPNTLYFTKQIIKADKYGALDIKVNNTGFNSSTGYKAEGSKEQLDDIKKRSYTLLAPFSEKLQVVLDPDLCREFVAQGKRPAGSCDNQISDFLNLMLSILIGVAVVVLVVQIILKGYQYMVTDIPFLKASAKSRLLEASLGLLLALSSYLILNTINPKLVSNDINIDKVSIGVDDQLAINYARYDAGSGPLTPEQIKEMRVQYGKQWDIIKTVYIPARDRALPGLSRGIKILMTAQTTFEGFKPGSCSWKMNNPGNIGNTDCSRGNTNPYPSLEDGIRAQYEHAKKIAEGNEPNYKIGQHYKDNGAVDNGIQYPGIDIIYNGTLQHYMWKYAAGTRPSYNGVPAPKGYNNYISFIISFFKKETITIAPETKTIDIYNMK